MHSAGLGAFHSDASVARIFTVETTQRYHGLGNRVMEGGSSRPVPDKAEVNLSRYW